MQLVRRSNISVTLFVTKGGNINMNKLIIGLTIFLLTACAVSADNYVGGIPLTTVEEGTVNGGVYFDSYYGLGDQINYNPITIDKTFTLPGYTNIEWAMLLTTVYCGHMQFNYTGTANITFNGAVLGNETLNVPFVYKNNGGDGYVWVNDHVNRVTSDYMMWYNVTDLVHAGDNTASVHTENSSKSSFDGRIKLITLIVAYNDGSGKKIHYWVNRGHDTDTYYSTVDYIGSTGFAAALPAGAALKDASLTAVHMASVDGSYTFNSNNIPSGTPQGSYSGSNTWNVTASFNPGGTNSMTYNRTDAYYKIALGILTAEYQEQVPGALGISANPATVTVAIPTDVTFNVTSDSAKISEATVTLSGSATGSGTTDANGTAVISVNATGAGTITATASKAGYIDATATLIASVKHGGVSSKVSLGASIIPAISLVVTPDAIDFGKLSPGQTSSAHTLTLNNTGGYGISVSAEVNDIASNLFVNGLLLNSNAWSAYSTSIDSKTSKQAGASLKVPDDYAGIGAKAGTLVFWGEAK
jgi:hypothetical protein